MTDKQKDFHFNLELQFILKDCRELISETLAEEIELNSWDFEERKGMLAAIDEVMDTINNRMPKFEVSFKRKGHLKLVSKMVGDS